MERHRPAIAALADRAAAARLAQRVASAGLPTRVLGGPDALATVATLPEADVVMAAIVGAAGLAPTLAAAAAGKQLPAREQGGARARGHAAARRGAGERGAHPADRQRAQRGLPVPASRKRRGHATGRRRPHRVDGIGRPVPAHASRGPRGGDAGTGRRASELAHGAEDLGGFGDAR